MEQVVVIGGGAAGMAAAIAAADAGSSVVLLEGGKQPGKKILSTGNGRCNLTNLVQMPSCYHTSEGQEEQTAWQVIRRFGCEETKQFFGSLGLYFKNRDGYLYPRSSQAQTVLSALVEGMEQRHVDVRTEAKVCGIENETMDSSSGRRSSPFRPDPGDFMLRWHGCSGNGLRWERIRIGESIWPSGESAASGAGSIIWRNRAIKKGRRCADRREDHSSGKREESCFRHGRASDYRLWNFRDSGISGEPVRVHRTGKRGNGGGKDLISSGI